MTTETYTAEHVMARPRPTRYFGKAGWFSLRSTQPSRALAERVGKVYAEGGRYLTKIRKNGETFEVWAQRQ